MSYSKVIEEAVSFIHSGEEQKKFVSTRLLPLKNGSIGFLSDEILEQKIVFSPKPAELDCKIVGVDSGFVDKKLSSVDIVLVRAVGVCFEFEKSKINSVQYVPSIYNFPIPHISRNSLELDESNCSRSLTRLKEEISVAKKCIEKFSPAYCFLDGSLVPQYADKPRSDSAVNEMYHSIIREFESLYALAEEKNSCLVGCVEDSRGRRFCDLLAQEILPQSRLVDPSLVGNVFDSSLLGYFLEKGERTMAFRYTKDISRHAILKDFDKKWGENIYSFYLKPSELDAPLRAEFLCENGEVSKKADKIASVVFALSGVHREYAYPNILIEADLRARLTPQEIEIVFGKIFDKLSRHVKLKMRRDRRPF
ncbi:MAG: DNA double-strand break repair nuclease NurA [Candidatus Diapherotrites archaeon]|nr:DNA double-strand break repair nuclease NurA [Candidatus Diapherotrites archaeon]